MAFQSYVCGRVGEKEKVPEGSIWAETSA